MSFWFFEESHFFLGGRDSINFTEARVILGAPKFLRVRLYHWKCTRVKILECTPSCARPAKFLKLPIFSTLALFRKIKVQKDLVRSPEEARVKNFHKYKEFFLWDCSIQSLSFIPQKLHDFKVGVIAAVRICVLPFLLGLRESRTFVLNVVSSN